MQPWRPQAPLTGEKGGGIGLDEFFLLQWSEFDHPSFFVGVTKCCEDFSGNAKVGMVHVPALLGLRQRESEAAAVGGTGWHRSFRGMGCPCSGKYKNTPVQEYKNRDGL